MLMLQKKSLSHQITLLVQKPSNLMIEAYGIFE